MTKIPQSKLTSMDERRAANTSRKRSLETVERPAAAKTAVPRRPGKIDKVIAMMRRPKGASIVELSKATDWQAHSVRGAISGTIKKKHGLKVISEKSGDVRTYRIAG